MMIEFPSIASLPFHLSPKILTHNLNVRLDGLLCEPVKLMGAEDRIGYNVQSADDGRCGRIGLPNCGRSKISCKFQTERGKIRRPGQNRICA